MKDQADESKLTCIVKWFNPVKGYGFVVPQGGGEDILLHSQILMQSGRKTIASDTRVDVGAVKVDGRWQVQTVYQILSDHEKDLPQLAEFSGLTRAELAFIPYQPARVKWYDQTKGIGFVNTLDSPEDVFLHAEVLRSSGFISVDAGEAVLVRTVDSARGRLAVELTDWFHRVLSFETNPR